MDDDDTERYRTFAGEVLRDRFAGNMSAMAREIGFQPGNLTRFVSKKQGKLSTRYTRKLCEVGGQPFPLPKDYTYKTYKKATRAHAQVAVLRSSPPPPAPTPAPKRTMEPLPTIMDDLDKVLELFGADYSHATAGAARAALVGGDIRRLSPKEWLTALSELHASLEKWVAKYKPIEIENPEAALYPRVQSGRDT